MRSSGANNRPRKRALSDGWGIAARLTPQERKALLLAAGLLALGALVRWIRLAR